MATIKRKDKYWFSINDSGVQIYAGSLKDIKLVCKLEGSNENAALAGMLVHALNGDQATSFAKWIVAERYNWDGEKGRYVAAWNNYSEHTTHELFKIYQKEYYSID